MCVTCGALVSFLHILQFVFVFVRTDTEASRPRADRSQVLHNGVKVTDPCGAAVSSAVYINTEVVKKMLPREEEQQQGGGGAERQRRKRVRRE